MAERQEREIAVREELNRRMERVLQAMEEEKQERLRNNAEYKRKEDEYRKK